jgi:hypothetical protein
MVKSFHLTPMLWAASILFITETALTHPLTLALFCHSPVFRIMNSFQRQGMLSDAAFNDDILTNLALSSISTQKKAGDRLICKSSSI